jgi:transposase-like protein
MEKLKKTEVNTFITEILCDECKQILVNEGIIFGSYPQRYSYACQKCGKRYTSTVKYPLVEYQPKKTVQVIFRKMLGIK